jgi:hypothetical protein
MMLTPVGVPQKERDDGGAPRIQVAICLGWRKNTTLVEKYDNEVNEHEFLRRKRTG